ncbi:hypothetical protein B0T21DRAFT_372904 [Apiosordaria backusii]|uniref:Uncharacterized protein n=1 Tax=Apiosordaria backusii TaxID=314023 RepID=A0AA40AXT7_9PEZI|nr:hypothetical protein B0T21DRAFT_372904 [Apiosordaria backusii]
MRKESFAASRCSPSSALFVTSLGWLPTYLTTCPTPTTNRLNLTPRLPSHPADDSSHSQAQLTGPDPDRQAASSGYGGFAL